MKHNIQNLIVDLAFATENNTNTISDTAKGILDIMKNAINEITENDPQRQQKMITLFMGGTILALNVDQQNHNYSPELYSEDTANDVFQGTLKPVTPELLIEMGNAAFIDLPKRFNTKMFEIETKLIYSPKPVPFFPLLKQKLDKIAILVAFCIKHGANLEQPEMEIAEYAPLDTDQPGAPSVSPSPQTATPHNTVAAGDVAAEAGGGGGGGGGSRADSSIDTKEDFVPPSPSSRPSISMQILSGFAMVLGTAAVATAFIVLNAATLGLTGIVTASLGAAAILGGVGFFACSRCCRKDSDESLGHSGPAAGAN